MANKKVLYSVYTAILGFICFLLGAAVIGLPYWGYFYEPENLIFRQGYFGAWRVCKLLLYNRVKCGVEVAKFRPILAMTMSGVAGLIGVLALGIFSILSVIQLIMVSSKRQILMKYSKILMLKLALALAAALLSVVCAGLFILQYGDNTQPFTISIGEAFYVQMLCIVLNIILFIMSVCDMIYSRSLSRSIALRN